MTRSVSESMDGRSGEPSSEKLASTGQMAVICLVWSARNDSLPVSVRQSLERRQVRIVTLDSPLAIMLQLALSPANLLMLVNPNGLPDRSQVIAAIQKYYPQVLFWQCSGSHSQPVSLSRWTPDSALFTETASSLSPAPSNPTADDFTPSETKNQPLRPFRRIPYPGTQARSATRTSRPKPPPPPAHLQLDAGPLLTRQELEMLLNDESAMRADRSPLSDDGL